MENRNILVFELMQHHVLLSRKIQLDQFRRGLNTTGLLKLAGDDPELKHVLFPDDINIAFDVLKGKVFLKEGETKDTDEKENAFKYFLQYLQEKCELQDGEPEPSILDVLQF
ncbi:uncharacterized protein [Ptychodera flava]|uniref:uncharacterized protein n=1 Tax=Ptychodera flava TaxID=63121 RepID=UPI00396A8C9D